MKFKAEFDEAAKRAFADNNSGGLLDGQTNFKDGMYYQAFRDNEELRSVNCTKCKWFVKADVQDPHYCYALGQHFVDLGNQKPETFSCNAFMPISSSSSGQQRSVK